MGVKKAKRRRRRNCLSSFFKPRLSLCTFLSLSLVDGNRSANPFRPFNECPASSRTISAPNLDTNFVWVFKQKSYKTMVHHKQVRSLKALPVSNHVSINIAFWDSSVEPAFLLDTFRNDRDATADRGMSTVSFSCVFIAWKHLHRTACISPLLASLFSYSVFFRP